MLETLIQIATAFLGSLGFALLFGLRRRYVLPAAVGGMLSWAVYMLLSRFLPSAFLSCLVASACAVLYAELLAHLLRTPATVFVIPAVIPLVPAVVFFIFALIADSSGWVIAWCIAGVISLILYLIWVANNT